MELGDYCTEPEILAELHLRYPWVKLGRRNGVSGNAHLTAKDKRSRVLLAGLRTLNGKICVFLPLESGTRRTSDGGSKTHHGQARSTRRASTGYRTHDTLCPSGQTSSPHGYGEGCALRETTPGKVQQGLRELQNETIREGPTAVLQLPEVWPHGQDMLEGNPDMQVLCWKPPIKPMQRGQPDHPQVCQLRRGPRNHQQGVPQKAIRGKQIQGSTEESRAVTDTNCPNQECLDQNVCAHNGRLPTNLSCSRGPAQTEAYSRSIEATSRTTVTRTYQDHSSRSATSNTQGTTPRTTEGRKSIGKKHLIPTLRKMIEAALDTLTA